MFAPILSKLRNLFWPIYGEESKKIIPMMLMIFFICFNQTILRNIKDVIVITARSSGVEAIPFIKVWVLLPMAIIMTVVFTALSNRFSQEKVFYFIISGFLLFFALFAYLFYPFREVLHFQAVSHYLENILPSGCKGLIAMICNWTFSLFYVMCELWGSIVLQVLFWGFANHITKISEASRFYGMLGVVSSSAATIAGVAANLLTNDESWDKTLHILVTVVIISGCLAMSVFHWMNKRVLDPSEVMLLAQKKAFKKPKQKLSIKDSLSYLSKSRYLTYIAILVFSYNIVIHLVEVSWKDQLSQLYSSEVEYSRYINWLTALVGVIATLASLFMPQLLYRFGWTSTALITPLMLLITSAGFFAFIFFGQKFISFPFISHLDPLKIAVFFGASQVCLSKACKYSVFDSTKEMAFIPLEQEAKLKGKAAIDGVGSRLGKSSGSLIYQCLFLVFNSVSESTPYIAIILALVILGWIITTISLGKQFELAAESKDKDAAHLNNVYKPAISTI